jgi:predicted DNA binding CopG/RHH family protein
MSRVPFTIDVDRYICSELENMRNMYKNRDFSGMMANIERIQQHGTAMEEALWEYRSKLQDVEKEAVDFFEELEKQSRVPVKLKNKLMKAVKKVSKKG